jgi:hypothetical protein
MRFDLANFGGSSNNNVVVLAASGVIGREGKI